jgi:hypothetical protein
MAGFAAGPAAWAIHQQAGYVLAALSCEHRMILLPLLTAASAIVVLSGGYLSWFVWRSFPAQAQDETRHFLAGLSLLCAVLFAFAILLQGAATLFLEVCER